VSDLEKRLRAAREAAHREERERQEREEAERRRRAPLEALRERYHLVRVPPRVDDLAVDVPASHAGVVRDFVDRLPGGAWSPTGWIVADHEGVERLVPLDGFVHVITDRGRHWRSPEEWMGPAGRQQVPGSGGGGSRKATRFVRNLEGAVERAKRALDHDGVPARAVNVELLGPEPEGGDWEAPPRTPVLVDVDLLEAGGRVRACPSAKARLVRPLEAEPTWGTVDEFTRACVEKLLKLERGEQARRGT
jgi:hypothetical protein